MSTALPATTILVIVSTVALTTSLPTISTFTTTTIPPLMKDTPYNHNQNTITHHTNHKHKNLQALNGLLILPYQIMSINHLDSLTVSPLHNSNAISIIVMLRYHSLPYQYFLHYSSFSTLNSVDVNSILTIKNSNNGETPLNTVKSLQISSNTFKYHQHYHAHQAHY
jgi:hypothetical protein